MNKITEAVSKIMHLGDSEKPAEEPNPEEQPTEQPQVEEAKQEETPQEQPAPEPAPEQPAIEPPPAEPSTPEAPKQQEPHSEQPIEPQSQTPKPPEGQLLSPNERVNAAYKLVYGKNAEIPIRHESINNEQDADWFVRSYLGILFATPNDNPLTQKFSNLEKLLTWFYKTHPLQEQGKQGE